MESKTIESIKRKCSACKVNLPVTQEHFKLKRGGDFTKQCIKCIEMKKNSQIKNRCEHNRQRCLCKICGGASICEHNRQRNECKDCGGTSICEHNRKRSQCKDCGGASICEHNRKRSQCKDCGGTSICEHQRRKVVCKECNDPIPITIRNMIIASKQKDKKYNLYDQTNFIDYCFVENLIDDCGNKCYYCNCEIQYQEYSANLATIERIDNSIGHTKGNCVIACRTCNVSKVGDRK